MKASAAAWRAKNGAAYRADHKDKIGGQITAWKHANPERRKAHTRTDYAKNKARFHAHTAKRRAHQHLAIAPWADLAAIKAIYAEAAGRRNAKGEMVHVDHVIPLKHPLVCGLHVETNLQIVPALANWSKNNRHWPDMG